MRALPFRTPAAWALAVLLSLWVSSAAADVLYVYDIRSTELLMDEKRTELKIGYGSRLMVMDANVRYTGGWMQRLFGEVKEERHTTLVVLDQDLRQDHAPPVKTKVQPQIWNQNETSLAGTTRCITLWEQSLLPVYGNLFLRANLQTNAGRARLDGVGSTQCPGSEDTPLLGVENRILVFSNGKYELTGETLQITGTEFAQLRYDLPSPPEEKNHKP